MLQFKNVNNIKAKIIHILDILEINSFLFEIAPITDIKDINIPQRGNLFVKSFHKY